jgi:hypothetical protein
MSNGGETLCDTVWEGHGVQRLSSGRRSRAQDGYKGTRRQAHVESTKRSQEEGERKTRGLVKYRSPHLESGWGLKRVRNYRM